MFGLRTDLLTRRDYGIVWHVDTRKRYVARSINMRQEQGTGTVACYRTPTELYLENKRKGRILLEGTHMQIVEGR